MARTRYYATYSELFSQHLEQLIERGGSAYEIVRLAKIYDKTDAEMRQEEFKDWVLQTAAFTCSRCGRVFSPDKTVGEKHEVVCPWCE